jgi:hypothetical protein
MHGKLVSLGFIIFLCSFSGCIDPPPSPLGSIPRVLIDHIEDDEETKIYIQGLDDYLYSNITIQINNNTITENYTYGLHLTTTLEKFALNISVWDELKEYEYMGNFTMLHNDDGLTLEIQDDRNEDPIKRSLPYKMIMERKE